MKNLSKISVKSNKGHKQMSGIITGYEKDATYTILNGGETEFTTEDKPFEKEYTEAEWEEFKKEKAYITLMKDLDRNTPGIKLEETELDADGEKVKLRTVTRMYPTVGGEVSLSALVSGAKALANKKSGLTAPSGAIILKGRDEDDILKNFIEQADEFASKEGKVQIIVLKLDSYNITVGGKKQPIKVVWFGFVNLNK